MKVFKKIVAVLLSMTLLVQGATFVSAAPVVDASKIPVVLIVNKNKKIILDASDLGVVVDAQKKQELAGSIYSQGSTIQNPYSGISLKLDDAAFSRFMNAYWDYFLPADKKIIDPKDSYIKFDTAKQTYVIVPSVKGNEPISREAPGLKAEINKVIDERNSILSSNRDIIDISGQITIDLEKISFFKLPQVSEDNADLKASLDIYNKYMLRTIEVEYLNSKKDYVKLTDHMDWFTPKYKEGSTIALNPDNPFTYDMNVLASFFLDSQKVAATDDYKLNKEKSLEAVLKTIDNYQSNTKVKIVYYQPYAPSKTGGGGFSASTYAAVSIADQHMWFYKDGVCIMDSAVVTGNPNLGRATPKGTFQCYSKSLNAVLNGPDYSQPVSFWMPFNRGVGFHDANWQPTFGGQRYLSYGSHGCINMPYAKAQQLYNLIYVGCPVYVY